MYSAALSPVARLSLTLPRTAADTVRVVGKDEWKWKDVNFLAPSET